MSDSNSPVILWCGRFSKADGYGTVARNHLRGLVDIGARVAAFDLQLMELVGPETGAGLSLRRSGARVEITADDPNDVVVAVFHERPDHYPSIRVDGRARLIGHSVFETDSLPPAWVDNLVSMDEVWVATDFNRQSFSNAGVPPFLIRQAPHSLDAKAYGGQLGRLRFDSEQTCVFLSVCSALDRRDLGLLFRAFLRAFSASDDVSYVVKVRDDLATLDATRALLDDAALTVGGDAPVVAQKVRIIAAHYGHEEMIRLYAGCDVYLSPERANGWDLPTMEAMASGKLTIGADTGGSTEYTNSDVAIRVPVELDVRVPIPAVNPHIFYTAQWWPGLNEDDVVAALKQANDDVETREQMGSAARAWVREHYDVSVVARHIVDLVTPLSPHEVHSNGPARITISAKGAAWRSPKDQRSELSETIVAGGLLEAASHRFDPRAMLAHYRDANDTRGELAVGERGPLMAALSAAVSTPKHRPIKKTARIAQLARELSKSTGSPSEREQVRLIARGLKSIRSSPAIEPDQITDDEVAARRAAFGRFPLIPLSGPEQERLRSLRNIHHGERCFILGNGPSLNKTDLSKLKDEYTFGVNKIYLLFDRIDWRPTYYTLLDWRVGPEIAPDIEILDGSVKFFPNRFRGILPPDDQTFWYTTRPVFDDISQQFAPDIVAGVPSRGTVLVTAIQIAFFLGFREIHLIGVDASYTIPDTVIQSGPDRFGTGVSLNLESTKDDDPNHFDPRYFGAGAKWHDPNVDEMVRMFRTMRKGVELHGGRLLNATVGGALEVLPRVEFDSLFD